jgi:hypothetical protein
MSSIALEGYFSEGLLRKLKKLFKRGNLTKNTAIINNNWGFCVACARGQIETCKWLNETFELNKSDAQSYNNYSLRSACRNGHMNVCEWLVLTFHYKKEDFIIENKSFYDACFYDARIYEDFKYLSYLRDMFDFNVGDIESFMNEIPEEKREKIIECLTPIGLLTKATEEKR